MASSTYDAIVIGGGLGAARGPYWDTALRATREHIWAQSVRSIPIVRAALGERAGVIGAGLIALDADRGSQLTPTSEPDGVELRPARPGSW